MKKLIIILIAFLSINVMAKKYDCYVSESDFFPEPGINGIEITYWVNNNCYYVADISNNGKFFTESYHCNDRKIEFTYMQQDGKGVCETYYSYNKEDEFGIKIKDVTIEHYCGTIGEKWVAFTAHCKAYYNEDGSVYKF